MKRVVPWLAASLIRLLGATLRMTLDDRGEILGQRDRAPVIIAFWHNRTALMALFNEKYVVGYTPMTFISRSRDGQVMTDVAAQFGIKAARGSSSRNGVAATLTALHAARDPKTDIAITPDGPRGPKYVVQPGVLRLAQATGRPIVAVTYDLPGKWELKSWDRFHIPKPFTKCCLITKPPIFVPKGLSKEELAVVAARLTEELGGD